VTRLTLDSRIRRTSDVVFQELDGEVVLVNLARGTCFTLDPVGTRIWQLLDEVDDLVELGRTLTVEFEVEEETALHDLLAIVADLVARELVTICD
jgi:hypothetical protein